jgi:hypothetical protein
MYKPSNGINPEINQAALGNHKGPSRDTLPSGAKWYWDLEAAEKEISQKICSNATRCRQLVNLGRYADVCGYCKTTSASIPIVRNGTSIQARYPSDSSLMCDAGEIVTSGSGTCPAEGFSDYAGSAMRIGIGSRQESFRNKTSVEGFLSLDDIDSCKPPLTRDCVVLAARLSGCSDNGTLIKALQGTNRAPYDTNLQNSMSFSAYQSSANPNITGQVLKDGSSAITTALDDFSRLMQNTTVGNEKVRAAARDLCLSAGEYDTYDFCKEISDTSVINKDTLKCVQENWKQMGGTESGSEYPTAEKYIGKTWNQYVNIRNSILQNIRSENKQTNILGLKQFLGIDTQGEQQTTTVMARDETTRGAETVWIDTRDNMSGSLTPIILKCEMKLAKDGPVYPEFADKQTMANTHGVPQDNIAFTTAFELRPENDAVVSYQVTTDDGFMLSMNQNPFENTNYRDNDWGSWRYQGPTTYLSKSYAVRGAKKSGTNTVVFKWFHGGGIAAHTLYPKINGVWKMQKNSIGDRSDTQEPIAPWLQYELCERPNLNEGNRMGFFEKRWNGPAAYAYGTNKPIPSFDTYSKSVVFNTQEKCMTFTKGSSWHTASKFAYTAFRTLTLCVRPRPTLANGATGSIFTHANIGGLDIGFNLRNNGGTYVFSMWNGRNWINVPAVLNEWNFIVIQYAGDRNGVRNISMHADSMTNLRNPYARTNMLRVLTSSQGGGGSVLAGDATYNKNHAGYLVLGTVSETMKDIYNNPVRGGQESFTGDVKWIHGFRNYLDTETLLVTEIEQRWISRWPRDMPVVSNTQKTKTFIGYEGEEMCVPSNTEVVYEAAGASKTKTVSGCFRATNQYFDGDPKYGVRKSVFAQL